jgi:hypothetical protein
MRRSHPYSFKRHSSVTSQGNNDVDILCDLSQKGDFARRIWVDESKRPAFVIFFSRLT